MSERLFEKLFVIISVLVDLREVKEVRLGKFSKDFDRWAEDARKFDCNRCYVVYYCQEFTLKTLSIGG